MVKKSKYRWFLVFAWVLCIYSTLYIVRPICEFLKTALPFAFWVNFFIVTVLIVLIAALCLRFRIKNPVNFGLIGIVLILYFIGLLVIKYPEEKIHFVEYGVLAFLIFRALEAPSLIRYLGALVLASVFGLGDECIQRVLPNRYFQWNDVLLNFVSAALGLLIVFIFRREASRG